MRYCCNAHIADYATVCDNNGANSDRICIRCAKNACFFSGLALAIHRRLTSKELKARTKKFALGIITLARSLPTDGVTAVLVRQIVRSGTSVGANYRSSCRAKSKPDFISKMSVAEEEADETQYWLEVLTESGIVKSDSAASLIGESEQLVRIFVASINTARGHPR